MQTKLTLRVDEAVARRAKKIAQKRGTSVSRIFGEFIAAQRDELPTDDLPPITASMLGVAKKAGVDIQEAAYLKHLEDRFL